MAFKFTVLASGSRGNAALLQSPELNLLIDAGLNGRQLESRLAAVGLGLKDIGAVVLTHEHGDHTAGLPVLLSRGGCRIVANHGTWSELQLEAGERWTELHSHETLRLADLTLESFAIPHDAIEPVGLRIRAGDRLLGVVTDLGFSTQLVVERVRGCDILLLETNYDTALLQADLKRPWPVKQRISGRHGHLSNDAAAALLAQVATPALREVFLAHLSEDCNRPELAEEVIRRQLEALGLSSVRVHCTGYATQSATVEW
jgi:phosphoribosyl 1,2-cyclic phosphodiesterase